ncbi:hypothetical protein TrRE_jg12877 [Triparma retinervis]|uniref:LOV domain-containing protein n=1 Tax=Triparma retinervis TaxID=2557542 RepID=A0A9W7FES2_9STRA|nr:hypothetical protein TrRE_jg12877 [Triparma retinervis]
MDGFALPTFTSFTSAAAMKKSPSNQSLGGASIDFDVLSAYLEQDGAYGFNENALPPSLLPSSGASSTGSDGNDGSAAQNFGTMWDFQAPGTNFSAAAEMHPVQSQKAEVQRPVRSGTRSSSRRITPPTSYSAMTTTTTTTKGGRSKAGGKKRKNSNDSGSKMSATKSKSQAQVDRRRERNRILARRTRLRKKFFFENLQAEVANLQGQNQKLKEIVASKLPKPVADGILSSCQMELPACVLEDPSIGSAEYAEEDTKFAASLRVAQASFCISDPSLPDCPIVYASPGFCDVTGYDLAEALGRNCRFLQGPGTSLEKVTKLRDHIRNGQDVSVTLLNYKKDGTPFWNSLFVASLMDTSGNVVNHIGVLTEVAGPPPGDPEFEKAEQQKIASQGETDDPGDLLLGDVEDDFL